MGFEREMRSRTRRGVVATCLAAIAAACLLPAPASADHSGSTTFTFSSYTFNYDAYVGTLALQRPGESAPYKTVNAFELELRISLQVADDLIAASGGDPRVASGLAGQAPDGNPWITGADSFWFNDPHTSWVEYPDGANFGQPAFAAESRLTAALAPQPQLAPGETASCTENASEVGPISHPYASVINTIGPGTVQTGEQRRLTFYRPAGGENFDEGSNFMLLQLHRIDRTCTVPDVTPPDTKIDKGPKKKLRSKKARKKVTFEFSADEPGTSFECSVDGTAFAPCTSPFKTAGKEIKASQKHTFSVRALDAAGNADPTPSSQSWKLKKLKK